MDRVRTLLATSALALAAVVVLPAVAAGAASPPANDNPVGAKVLGALPWTWQESTGAATTSDLERSLARSCGVETVRKGVWFKFTPGSSFTLRLSAADSSYSAGLMVMTGSKSNTKGMTCKQEPVFKDVAKGTTYWILAYDSTPASTGGTLRLAASKAPPVPTVTIAVTRGVAKPSTGAARIFGTATCRGWGSQLAFVQVEVSQQMLTPQEAHGIGWINVAVPCDKTPIAWQVDVLPQPLPASEPGEPAVVNPFEPGPAGVIAVTGAHTPDGREEDASTSVTLTLTSP